MPNYKTILFSIYKLKEIPMPTYLIFVIFNKNIKHRHHIEFIALKYNILHHF